MKNVIRVFVIIVIASIIGLSFIACGGGGGGSKTSLKATANSLGEIVVDWNTTQYDFDLNEVKITAEAGTPNSFTLYMEGVNKETIKKITGLTDGQEVKITATVSKGKVILSNINDPHYVEVSTWER